MKDGDPDDVFPENQSIRHDLIQLRVDFYENSRDEFALLLGFPFATSKF